MKKYYNKKYFLDPFLPIAGRLNSLKVLGDSNSITFSVLYNENN